MSKHLLRAIPVMSERNLDIRMGTTITNCQKAKGGYLVTIGVDEGTGSSIMHKLLTGEDNYRVCLMAINSRQLTEVSKELEDAEISGAPWVFITGKSEDLPEDIQVCLWYYKGLGEPPYVGSMMDKGFPGSHVFFCWCPCPAPSKDFIKKYNR